TPVRAFASACARPWLSLRSAASPSASLPSDFPCAILLLRMNVLVRTLSPDLFRGDGKAPALRLPGTLALAAPDLPLKPNPGPPRPNQPPRGIRSRRILL